MSKDIFDALEKKLQKDYGDDIIVSGNHLKSGDLLSTGILSLDIILGGGLRAGTILELYGKPGSGKTSVALYMAGQAQKKGRKVIFLDVEYSLKPELINTIEVLDKKELVIIHPLFAEDALDIVEQYVKSGEKVFVIIDSIAALVPKKEAEESHEQETMAVVARLMSKTLRKVIGPCARSESNIVYINQLREKMVMYGNPEVRPGGKALGFFATYEIDCRASGSKKDMLTDASGNVMGHTLFLKTTKNKLFTPYKSASLPLIYGKGFDVVTEIIGIASELSIINRKGPRYYMYDKNYLGMDELKKDITDNKELLPKIKADIFKMFNFEV